MIPKFSYNYQSQYKLDDFPHRGKFQKSEIRTVVEKRHHLGHT